MKRIFSLSILFLVFLSAIALATSVDIKAEKYSEVQGYWISLTADKIELYTMDNILIDSCTSCRLLTKELPSAEYKAVVISSGYKMENNPETFKTFSFIDDMLIEIHMLVGEEPVPVEINITSPIEKNYNSSETVQLTYNVLQGTPDKIWYSLNGGDNTTISGSVSLSGLIDGENIIKLFANNSIGEETNNSVTFNYVLPIMINLTSPETKIYSTITINYTISQGTPDQIWFDLDGKNYSSISSDDISNDTHKLIIYANNSLGEIASDYVYFIKGSDTFSSDISVFRNFGDKRAITADKISVYIGEVVNGLEIFSFDLRQTVNLDLQKASYIIKVEKAGYETDISNMRIFGLGDQNHEVYLDSIFEINIDMNSPEEKTYDTTNIKLEYNTSLEPDAVWYSINNGENISIPSEKEGSIDLIFAEGAHNITIYANNSLNEANDFVNFTIDLPDNPQPPSGGSPSSSGGPGYDSKSLDIILDEQVSLERGTINTLKILINNTRNIDINAITLKIDKLPSKWNMTFEPTKLDLVKNKQGYFNVKIDIPQNETGNHTVWIEVKSGLKRTRQKAVFTVIPKSESNNTNLTLENQTIVNTETNQTGSSGNATGLISTFSGINPLYAVGIVLILVIIATIVYIYFKDIEEVQKYIAPVKKQVKAVHAVAKKTASIPNYKSKFR
jgi:hypothetical protein